MTIAAVPDIIISRAGTGDCSLCRGPVNERAELVACEDCGATWDFDGRQGEPGPAAPPVPVDTNAAAVAVRRSPTTIRDWAHKKWLHRIGSDRANRAIYDLNQVHAVDNRIRTSRGKGTP